MKVLKFFERVARVILPASIFFRLKRWVRLKLNGKNILNRRLKKLQRHSSVFNETSHFYQFSQIPPPIFGEQVSLVICCAFTGRYEILAQSISESFHSGYADQTRWVLCGSNKEDKLFIEEMQRKHEQRVSGIIWKNNPLGEKWQAALSFAKEFYSGELFAITGSDDMMSSKLLNTIIEKYFLDKSVASNSIPAMYATDQWFLVCLNESDSYSPGLIKCQIKSDGFFIPLGAGRFYTKEFLELVHYKIFDETLESCLDDYGYLKLRQLNQSISYYTPDDGALLSIKGDWAQMNTVQVILDSPNINAVDCSINAFKKLSDSLASASVEYLWNSNLQQKTFIWQQDNSIR